MKETIVGIIAGALTSMSVIPQLIKTIKERKVEDISPIMFLILFCGTGMWIYYGVLREDLPIVITNSFSILLTIVMLFLKFKFSK